MGSGRSASAGSVAGSSRISSSGPPSADRSRISCSEMPLAHCSTAAGDTPVAVIRSTLESTLGADGRPRALELLGDLRFGRVAEALALGPFLQRRQQEVDLLDRQVGVGVVSQVEHERRRGGVGLLGKKRCRHADHQHERADDQRNGPMAGQRAEEVTKVHDDLPVGSPMLIRKPEHDDEHLIVSSIMRGVALLGVTVIGQPVPTSERCTARSRSTARPGGTSTSA